MRTTPPSPRRVSELCDRLIRHLLNEDTLKALRIAQYLRASHGMYLTPGLSPKVATFLADQRPPADPT